MLWLQYQFSFQRLCSAIPTVASLGPGPCQNCSSVLRAFAMLLRVLFMHLQVRSEPRGSCKTLWDCFFELPPLYNLSNTLQSQKPSLPGSLAKNLRFWFSGSTMHLPSLCMPPGQRGRENRGEKAMGIPPMLLHPQDLWSEIFSFSASFRYLPSCHHCFYYCPCGIAWGQSLG